MKKLLFAGALFTLFAFIKLTPPITGRWKIHASKGPDFFINFKKDSTYTAYSSSGKVLVTGNYKTKEDTFLVNDANCNIAYWGTYHITFFKADSMNFKVVSDTCLGRDQGIDGLTFVRIVQP